MEEGNLPALLQLRIKHLRLLNVIQETGSLRRAAAELCVTQPAVSAMLKDVEQAFGGQGGEARARHHPIVSAAPRSSKFRVHAGRRRSTTGKALPVEVHHGQKAA